MAPKRKAKAVAEAEGSDASEASSPKPAKAKRSKKAAAPDDAEGSDDPKPKKARKAKEPVVPLDPDQPTNTAMPDSLAFAPRSDDAVRLSAWNITSVKSAMAKGFKVRQRRWHGLTRADLRSGRGRGHPHPHRDQVCRPPSDSAYARISPS